MHILLTKTCLDVVPCRLYALLGPDFEWLKIDEDSMLNDQETSLSEECDSTVV